MNKEQFEQFKNSAFENVLASAQGLVDRTPRTLIYGYTTDRNTFHVYLGNDGLIHVLAYSELYSPDETVGDKPRFLIMHHSEGESGGVTENAHFVPNKRVYPESCCLEFCSLLRRHGVSIPFAPFTDDAAAKRLEKFGDFAGYTFESPGGCTTVSLHEQLAAHEGFPSGQPLGGYRLTSRLVAQAAKELGVQYTSASDGSYVTVASTRSDEVLARAQAFLADIADVDMEPGIGKRLAGEVYGAYHQFWMQDESYYGGVVNATVNLEHVDFVADSSHQLFMGKPDAHYEKGILGSYSGRPFFACKTKGGETYLAYSQFGDTDRFLKEQLRQFSLTPLAEA